MSEKDKMVGSDKEFVIKAAEQVVVEIQKRWLKVSVRFSSFSYSDFDLFSGSRMIGG